MKLMNKHEYMKGSGQTPSPSSSFYPPQATQMHRYSPYPTTMPRVGSMGGTDPTVGRNLQHLLAWNNAFQNQNQQLHQHAAPGVEAIQHQQQQQTAANPYHLAMAAAAALNLPHFIHQHHQQNQQPNKITTPTASPNTIVFNRFKQILDKKYLTRFFIVENF